jgi:hypothetical protein
MVDALQFVPDSVKLRNTWENCNKDKVKIF